MVWTYLKSSEAEFERSTKGTKARYALLITVRVFLNFNYLSAFQETTMLALF